MAAPVDTLILGLGNPILGDDGIGWRVVEALGKLQQARPLPVKLDCLSSGGLDLMERMQGFSRVILVDAMSTGCLLEGSVSVFPLEELPDPSAGHSSSPHDASLMTALDAGRRLGLELPKTITVVAIEAATVHDFSEQLSPAAAAAVPRAAAAVLRLVQTPQDV